MSSYQYRKSHCGDKTVVRSSYLHNGISYTGKMLSLYWIGAQSLKVQTVQLSRYIRNMFQEYDICARVGGVGVRGSGGGRGSWWWYFCFWNLGVPEMGICRLEFLQLKKSFCILANVGYQARLHKGCWNGCCVSNPKLKISRNLLMSNCLKMNWGLVASRSFMLPSAVGPVGLLSLVYFKVQKRLALV